MKIKINKKIKSNFVSPGLPRSPIISDETPARRPGRRSVLFGSQGDNGNRGIVLLNTVVFGMMAVSLIIALTSWFGVTFKASRDVLQKELAFHIAEAGVEYYRWHLAHSSQDFQDGTGQLGPYVHDFLNKDGEKVGEFSLEITPPSVGSTLVQIESTGTLASTTASRTIRVQLAKPTFSKYAFVSNSEIRFGEGTEIFGLIHANDGVRFDGLAHNLVSSALETYDDPDHSGGIEWAAHTHLSPTDDFPPTAWADRPDVFEAGRNVSVPAIDFDGLTADMADLKQDAQDDGLYFGSSGKRGYRILLKIDDSFDVYKVTSVQGKDQSCNNALGQLNWGTWSIKNETFLANYAMPSNGIIFVEDHTWVEGQIDGSRVTIVAARFPDSPGNRRNIIINNDLIYTNYDGTDAIGLIAQEHINVGMFSDDDLDIDAAMIAQKGRVGRFYYRGPWGSKTGCSPYDTRASVDVYGMVATNERYGFAYTDSTGYTIRDITYDPNLFYAAPPGFPLTSDQYEVLTWEEI